MSEIITPESIQADISLNFRRLQESRAKQEPVLEKIFEQRMNRALDEYGDFMQFAGSVVMELTKVNVT